MSKASSSAAGSAFSRAQTDNLASREAHNFYPMHYQGAPQLGWLDWKAA